MQKQEAWLSQLFLFDCNDTGYFVLNVIANPVARWHIENANCRNYVICRRIATIFIPT